MTRKSVNTPNHLLRRAREMKGWSQEQVAAQIGASAFSVHRWERGQTFPTSYYCQQLSTLFGMTLEELGLLQAKSHSDSLSHPPTIWNIPYQRNPFFTGRKDVLADLSTVFKRSKATKEQCIITLNGLGGVGKTHAAIEYAYRHAHEYEAVLWVASDPEAIVRESFCSLASVLGISEQLQQDQQQIILAIQRWFAEHDRWLLIFDNVEELATIQSLLPMTRAGHIILTTRLQSTGDLAQQIEMDVMGPEEGVQLLLRRAKIISPGSASTTASSSEQRDAQTLSGIMGGLPLALDQAGAYIDETDCGVAGYLKRYQHAQALLLQLRGHTHTHPDSVATTWSLSFEKLQQSNPAAIKLLRLCALLHCDAIPEEIFVAQLPAPFQAVASDHLQLDAIIKALRTFSFIRRHPKIQALSIHRLVQTTLRMQIDEQLQRQLVIYLVQALNYVIQEHTSSTVKRYQRYLPHILVCAAWIKQWKLVLPDAAQLLYWAGTHLQAHALYEQAEPLYQQALAIRKQLVGADHEEVAQCLFSLASLYEQQWKEQQAELFYQQALDIRIRTLGLDHAEVAHSLHALAFFYYRKCQYEQAESLYQQALAIFERAPGLDHLYIAQCLNDLGSLYREQGKYKQVEPLHQQALAILERLPVPNDLAIATSLRGLAILYHQQGLFSQAEPLYQRALAIREHILGPDHPDVAFMLRGLGMLYQGQGKYIQAEQSYKRVLTIRQRTLGAKHPLVGDAFNIMAELYAAQGKWEIAEEYFQRALAIWEPAIGSDNPDVAQCLCGLAETALAQKKYDQAEILCQRATTIQIHAFGEEHHYVAPCLNIQAALCAARQQYVRAETLYQQALAIIERSLGKTHPEAIPCLKGLAELYQEQELYEQAEPLYRRMLVIYSQILDLQHPHVIDCQTQLYYVQQQIEQKTEA